MIPPPRGGLQEESRGELQATSISPRVQISVNLVRIANKAKMLLFIAFFISIITNATAWQQHVPKANFQISVNLVQNSSSNGVDFHISMASPLGSNGGWVALGTGNSMYGSLMFIMYTVDTKCTNSQQHSCCTAEADVLTKKLPI